MAGLKEIADEAGTSLTHLTLQWIASRPAVDNILLGPSSLAQLEDCLAAGDRQAPGELIEEVNAFLRDFDGTDATYAR